MNKKAKIWKELLAKGVKKDVFLQLLRERFPKGQFTFGDAIHAYEDAHHILHEGTATPKGLMGPRDVLRCEGALFELHTNGRKGIRDGWPSTSKKGLVTMPTSPRFKPLMKAIVEREIEDILKSMDRYGPSAYNDERVHKLREELRQYV